MFETRTDLWREAGLAAEIDRRDVHRAQVRLLFFFTLIAAVIVVFVQRKTLLPGYGTPIRVATVILLMLLGWGFATALGRGLAPALYRRMEPGTAGTIGFAIRLGTILVVAVAVLRIAGLNARAVALGGAFTAVVLGLAAQQTFGNLFAGIVLQGTRPFRVGERVRLVGGAMAGSAEGTVSSLGLFYTTFVNGADRMMVPNSLLLNLALVPLREPERVELRARFAADVSPGRVQDRLAKTITVPIRHPPHISLEEVDRDEVVLRIAATPTNPLDGARLAEEILAGTRGGDGRGRPDGDGADSGGNGGGASNYEHEEASR